MSGAACAAYRQKHGTTSTTKAKQAAAQALSSKNNYKFSKPAHHWEGFGRKNTIPSWYDQSKVDKARRAEVIWEASTVGLGPKMDHKSFDLTAPYIHDHSDSRCYRPDIVPDKRKLEVCVPAPPDQRMLVERNPNPALSEMGFNQKVSLYNKESIRVNRQREANVYAAHKSELHETIYGQARIIEKPILYPQNLSHDMALSLENKAGPCLPYDQRPPTKEDTAPRMNMKMYMPYSRTRTKGELM
mmetsp:Transcript_75288/g.214139  ORF Transcript_75288/g.214139 Transcript_75288/m.214139 type:complete len:244 (-) Transcript_75288:253-984(-)|eukprot:CAMPEP_0119493166 /NCGR_PEP_ID=MMETSP1344-20130328/17488_1 /TAXON_ID=236787 /ORGANISM="Florenciella parvula, Strain CCMP2471" /LENGTH=243 /DNA_ID=CAMNT_0007528567 /DNA_START=186 /DNA_END=917 /DNA_ORIENTATION=-